MDHKYIDVQELEHQALYKKDNNLDGKDNLDSLPGIAAVYGICGVVNGKPANCRYLGISENLQASVKEHFAASESDECLKTFMQSIKLKSLVYQPITSAEGNEAQETLETWRKKFDPQCNEKLNEVF